MSPLELVLEHADQTMRHRWVRQLLSAVTWLETLGYTHGDMEIRNIRTDKSNCLKLFDFGTATRHDNEDFNSKIKKDHSGLATCIHFILSGVDPFARAQSIKELRRIVSELREGKGEIQPGAEILGDIIQAGWTGRDMLLKLHGNVTNIIGPADLDDSIHSLDEGFTAMEAACVAWLQTAIPDPMWMSEAQYRAAWKEMG